MATHSTVHQSGTSFIKLTIPFSMGIVSVYELKFQGLLYGLMALVAALFVYLSVLNLKYKQLNVARRKKSTALLSYCLIYLIGCLCCTLYKTQINSDFKIVNKNRNLKIRIINEPKIKQNIIWFDALALKIMDRDSVALGKKAWKSRTASMNIRITVKRDTSLPIVLKYGDELMVPARLSETAPPANPGTFDFKSWLAAQRIYHQAYFKQKEIVQLHNNTGNLLLRHVLHLREREVMFYRKILKDDDAFAVAATLIFGYRSDLSDETLDIYSKTGTIHALSVSGMHVGLIYLVLNWLLSYLDRNRMTKILKMILTLVLIWTYALFTGYAPAVLRSAIMISVFILAKLFTKNHNSYNTIAFAAFCLLLYQPFMILDVGFQLSFLAVLGLAYLQPQFYGWISVRNRMLDRIWNALTMSLAAQTSTYPLSIYYFHQFPVYFLLSNLFILLPVTLIIYLGILISIFKLECLGPLFEWLLSFTHTGLSKIAGLPWSGISAIWISKTELICLSLALAAFILAMQHSRKLWLFISLTAFLMFQSLLAYDKILAQQQKKLICFKLSKNYGVAYIKGCHAVLYTDVIPGSKIFNYSIKPALDLHKVKYVTFKE